MMISKQYDAYNDEYQQKYVSFQHPQLMSGEDPDERKANALKQSLDYIDIFLDKVLISILVMVTMKIMITIIIIILS